MSTKDWIVLLVPIICNGIIVFAFQKILSKKIERYKDALEFYNYFSAEYAGSKYLNEAKTLSFKAQNNIIKIEKEEPQEIDLKPQEIPIDIIYEDKDILIINKAKGMVVHPGNGNPDGTLVNAVMAKCKDSLSGIGGKIRPGVVHRIDKDTSRTNNNCQE